MTRLLFRQTQLKTPTWWHSTVYTSSSSCVPSLCCLPFPHLSSSPLLSHFDPTTLNPPSTRQHGRQAATQTGDRKQLINILTPLHLPAPIWGGEPSTTKQPVRHTQANTFYTNTAVLVAVQQHKKYVTHKLERLVDMKNLPRETSLSFEQLILLLLFSFSVTKYN